MTDAERTRLADQAIDHGEARTRSLGDAAALVDELATMGLAARFAPDPTSPDEWIVSLRSDAFGAAALARRTAHAQLASGEALP